MLNDDSDLMPPPDAPIEKVIVVKVIDAEVYAQLLEDGYWVGFEMPVTVKGGN
jgi:hypothetical protein